MTLRQFSADSGASLEQVHHVHITVPSTLLQRGLVLVDTPGVNDLSEQRSDITYGFLPLADAAVLVLDATAPVTKSEAAFLTGRLLPTSFQRLMFVLGKSDRLSQEDLEEAIHGAQQRLRALVRLHDVEVIPVIALRRDNGHCPCISTLRERLIALASESHDSREDLTRRRLTILIAEILHEVESRIAIARMRPDEQALCRRDMEEGRTEIVSRHATFSKYVDTFAATASLRSLRNHWRHVKNNSAPNSSTPWTCSTGALKILCESKCLFAYRSASSNGRLQKARNSTPF